MTDRNQRHNGFSIRAEAGRAEILLYGVMDPWNGISAKEFHADLKSLGDVSEIDLRINSPGGSITEGMAFYSILKRQEAKVTAYVDGIAASMASVVAMAADEIVMSQGAYMMIHNPLGVAIGEASEMRDYADLLDKMKGQLVAIYAQRTKRPAEEIAALMDEETWFTADEAIAAGFADRSTAKLALAASLDAARFRRVPAELIPAAGAAAEPRNLSLETPMSQDQDQPRPAAYAELKTALAGADDSFVCRQMEANATVAQAQSAWMAEQANRLSAAETALSEAKAAAQAAAKRPGVEALGGNTGDAEAKDPVAAFNAAVDAKMAAGKKTRGAAIAAVVHEQPELHAAYLEAYNEANRQARGPAKKLAR